MDDSQKYRGYTIKLFSNGRKWDYFIKGITEKGYPSKRPLYETKEKAIERARNQIKDRRNNNE